MSLLQKIKNKLFPKQKMDPSSAMYKAINIVAKNGQCMTEGGLCSYNNKGKHCIIGEFLHQMGFETEGLGNSHTVYVLASKDYHRKDIREFLQKFDVNMLSKLQNVHDHKENWTDGSYRKKSMDLFFSKSILKGK